MMGIQILSESIIGSLAHLLMLVSISELCRQPLPQSTFILDS